MRKRSRHRPRRVCAPSSLSCPQRLNKPNKASSLANLVGGQFRNYIRHDGNRAAPELPSIEPGVTSGVRFAAFQQASHALLHGAARFHRCGRPSCCSGCYLPADDGQTLCLAFMDCFRVLGSVTLAMIPLVLANKFKPSGSAPAKFVPRLSRTCQPPR
jgi:hypothetical protein